MPLILTGENKKLSLSYLGHNVGYVLGKESSLAYHPESVLAAENDFRKLILQTADFDGKLSVFCQYLDKVPLELLPQIFANYDKIGIYSATIELTQKSLADIKKVLWELF